MEQCRLVQQYQSSYLVNESSDEEYTSLNQAEISLTHDVIYSLTNYIHTVMSHKYYSCLTSQQ